MPEFNPIKELFQIKNQIDSLKKRISTKISPADINSLSDASDKLNKIISIFEHASKEMEKAPLEDANKLGKSLEEIGEENKSIAKGIVVLAEMIKERLPEKHVPPHAQQRPIVQQVRPMPHPQPRPIPPPKMIQPQQQAPPTPHAMPPQKPSPHPSIPPPLTATPPKPAPTTMPPPLKPSPTPMPQLRREAPPLEKMPPPPTPPPEITGIPPPQNIPEQKPEKKGLLGKLFKKK